VAPKTREDLRPLRRWWLRRHQLHRGPLDGKRLGLVPGVPDEAREAVVQHPHQHGIGRRIGERDGLPGQRTGTVRVAAEERVLGRAPQDLDPGCPGKLASIRHAVHTASACSW
jgi:hypothetical protein